MIFFSFLFCSESREEQVASASMLHGDGPISVHRRPGRKAEEEGPTMTSVWGRKWWTTPPIVSLRLLLSSLSTSGASRAACCLCHRLTAGCASSLSAYTGRRHPSVVAGCGLRNPVLLVGRRRLSKVATNSCRLKQKKCKEPRNVWSPLVTSGLV